MSKKLGIVVVGRSHACAVQSGGGSVHLQDRETSSDLRCSDVLLATDGAWTGAAAALAQLAGVAGTYASMDASEIGPFDGAATIGRRQRLSPEGLLALFSRKSLGEARIHVGDLDRIVIALDSENVAISQLQPFLADALGIAVDLRPISWAWECALQSLSVGGRPCAMLAVLGDQSWVATLQAGRCDAARVAGHRGVAAIHDAVFEDRLLAIPEAWCRQHLWRDFISWFTGNSEEPFVGHHLDRRVPPRAIARKQACDIVNRVLDDAVTAFAQRVQQADYDPLLIVGDDALKLGVREATNRALSRPAVSMRLARVAATMAETRGVDHVSPQANADIGLLMGTGPGAPRALQIFVARNTTLPASLTLEYNASQRGQREFTFVLGSATRGGTRVLREVVFNAPADLPSIERVAVTVNVDAIQRVMIDVTEPVSGRSLQMAISNVASGAGSAAGPEEIARLPLLELA